MNKLFKENLKLVRCLVNKSYNKYKPVNFYLEKEDLMQEGLLGLYRATKLYNPERHVKFSTYAYKVINSFILLHVIKVNGYKSNLIIKSDTNTLLNKINTYMTNNENCTIENISATFNILKRKSRNIIKLINDIKKGSLNIDEFESTLIYKDNFNYPDIKLDIEQLLKILSKREREIIKLYYGLGRQQKNYKEIAEIYGCSKQMINQIVNKSLNKLRRNNKNELKEYIVN